MNNLVKRLLVSILFLVSICMPTISHAFGAPLTSTFGWRLHPVYGTYRLHAGIDLGVPAGTAVPAIEDGVVTFKGWENGYGYYLEVKMKDGYSYLYAHGTEYPPGIEVGVEVKKGQIVFISGNTGTGTAPHLHAELRTPNDEPIRPNEFYINHGWNLEGEDYSPYEGELWGGLSNMFGKIIPKIDFDYTTYFEPSKVLMDLTNTLLKMITEAYERLGDVILGLLVILATIDLALLLLEWITTGVLNIPVFVGKIFKYSFFGALARSWTYVIDDVFLVMFEEISTFLTGKATSVESFLQFDKLYTIIQSIMTHNFKPEVTLVDGGSSVFPFLIQNLVVWIILLTTIGFSVWTLLKIINFYIVAVFSIIGIPVHFIPTIQGRGLSMVGIMLGYTLDLVLTAFFINLVMVKLEIIPAIPKGDIVGLLSFATIFFILTIFVSKVSKSCSSMLTNLLH